MMASVSSAARLSGRLSVCSRRSRKSRSSAVRNAHLSARRTRLTPRAGVALLQLRPAAPRHRRPRPDAARVSAPTAARPRRTAAPRGCAGAARRDRGSRMAGFGASRRTSVFGLRAVRLAAAHEERPEGQGLAEFYLPLPHQFKAGGEGRGDGGDALLGRRRDIRRDRRRAAPSPCCRRSAG